MKYDLPDLVFAIEILADGSCQVAVKCRKKCKLVARLKRILGLSRQLRNRIPTKQISLLRCLNKDELPTFKLTGQKRGMWRVHNRRVIARHLAAKRSRKLDSF